MKGMQTFYKWGFYALLTILLSSILTVSFDRLKDKQQQKKIQEIQPRQYGWGRYFREQLGLNMEQHVKFREYRQDFHPKAHAIADELTIIREDIFTELNKKQPDTLKLNQLSEKVGLLHAKLKKTTYHYYLNIKNCCTKKQQIKLKNIFASMNEGDFTSHPKEDNKNKQFKHHHTNEGHSEEVFEEFKLKNLE